MSNETLQGRCLCGAARFTAALEKLEMDACHCSMCRRWAGGPVMTLSCVSLTIEDESAVAFYQSSDWAERGFCKTCGSSLFWRMRDGRHIAASAQAFDDPGRFPFVMEIFVDEKPANYTFANATRKMTGAEVVAAFTASQDKMSDG